MARFISGGTKVLLVDGAPSGMLGILRELERGALVASSLADARELCKRWSEHACRYALVNESLPDGSGLELLVTLSRLSDPPRVGFFSSRLDAKVALAALRCGAVATGFPEEPADVEQLLALLDRSQEPAEAHGVAFGDFVLEHDRLQTPAGVFRLRRVEAKLLAHLASRGGAFESPAALARAILGRGDDGAVRSIYSHVRNLRANLREFAHIVGSKPGYGYHLTHATGTREKAPVRLAL